MKRAIKIPGKEASSKPITNNQNRCIRLRMGEPVIQRTPRKWSVVKTHLQTPHQSHYLKNGTWIEEQGHPGTNRQHWRSTEQTGQLSFMETSPPLRFFFLLFLAAKRDISLQVSHLEGRTSLWMDALLQQDPSMVKWALSKQKYSQLIKLYITPHVCQSNKLPPRVPDKNYEDKCKGTRCPQGRLEKNGLTDTSFLLLLHHWCCNTPLPKDLSREGTTGSSTMVLVAQPWTADLLRWCPQRFIACLYFVLHGSSCRSCFKHMV